jgi:hypothetical protein
VTTSRLPRISTISVDAIFVGAGYRRENMRRRDNADALWREYEVLCLKYPKFASPLITNAEIEISEMKFDGDIQRFIQYEYFVSFLLYASEAVLTSYGNRLDWRRSVEDEVGWHKVYLKSNYFKDYLDTLSPVMRQVIRDLD